MQRFVIYHAESGEIIRIGTCPRGDHGVQVTEGHEAVLLIGDDAQVDDRAHRIVDGAIIDLPPKPPETILVRRLMEIRRARDCRLCASDHCVMPDRWERMIPQSRTAWADYRQALRDFMPLADLEKPAHQQDWPQAPVTNKDVQ